MNRLCVLNFESFPSYHNPQENTTVPSSMVHWFNGPLRFGSWNRYKWFFNHCICQYGAFHLILALQRHSWKRIASVLLPLCFRYAGKVAQCFRSVHEPLKYFFGKLNLALECLWSGPGSAKKCLPPFCFRFPSNMFPKHV